MKALASVALLALAAGLSAPAVAQSAPATETAAPAFPLTPQGAADFIAAAEKDLFDFGVEKARVDWINYTYINDTTDALAATSRSSSSRPIPGSTPRAWPARR